MWHYDKHTQTPWLLVSVCLLQCLELLKVNYKYGHTYIHPSFGYYIRPPSPPKHTLPALSSSYLTSCHPPFTFLTTVMSSHLVSSLPASLTLCHYKVTHTRTYQHSLTNGFVCLHVVEEGVIIVAVKSSHSCLHSSLWPSSLTTAGAAKVKRVIVCVYVWREGG